VAVELGLRMENHARCEAHRLAEHDRECPFCLDRQAYRAFQARIQAERGADR
jgi:hypothetical protein